MWALGQSTSFNSRKETRRGFLDSLTAVRIFVTRPTTQQVLRLLTTNVRQLRASRPNPIRPTETSTRIPPLRKPGTTLSNCIGPSASAMDSRAGSGTPGRSCSITPQGRIAKALNGWWIASIISMQSGLPINPLIGNRSLSNNPGAAGSATDRPDLDPSFDRHKVITHNPARWFDPTMFALPLAGTLGNAPRNFLRGPDLKNVDFAINKDTRLREQA